MGVKWVDDVPIVEIEPDGVRVTIASGAERLVVRLSRHTFRRYVETGIRMLNDADDAQQGKIVDLRGRCRQH